MELPYILNLKQSVQLLLIFVIGIIVHKPVLAFSCLTNVSQMQSIYQSGKQGLEQDPNNKELLHNMGVVSFCLNKRQSAVDYLDKSAVRGHIPSAHLLALYYQTDETLDVNKMTKNLERLNLSIHYYEQAVRAIKINNNYPYIVGVANMPTIEQKKLTSSMVFMHRAFIYVEFYNQIKNLESQLYSEEASQVLELALTSSVECLQWPTLKIWGNKQERVHNYMQRWCGAIYNIVGGYDDDGHLGILSLEKKRVKTARQCKGAVQDCPAYQHVIEEINKKYQLILRRITLINSI